MAENWPRGSEDLEQQEEEDGSLEKAKDGGAEVSPLDSSKQGQGNGKDMSAAKNQGGTFRSNTPG